MSPRPYFLILPVVLTAMVPPPSFGGNQPWTLDAVMSLRTVGDPQIKPDGTRVAYVVRWENRKSNRYDSSIRIVNIDGSSVRGIEPAHHSDHSPRWAPVGHSLAFLSSREGSRQVYLADLEKNRIRRITHAKRGVSRFYWSPDGQQIAYLAVDPPSLDEAKRIEAGDDPIVAEQGLKFRRIYLVPAAGGEARLLTREDRHVLSLDWSADGSKIVYAAQKTPENRWTFHVDIYEANLSTATSRVLVTQEGRDAEPSYSRDGKWIAFHSQTGTLNYFGERNIGLIPAGGGSIRYLTQGGFEADVFRGGNSFWWSPDGSRIVFTAGKGTSFHLYSMKLDDGSSQRLIESTAGSSNFSISADGGRIAYAQSSTSSPPEIYLAERKGERMATRPLTNINPQAGRYPTLRTETITWKSKDGSLVEGVLHYPLDYKAGRRAPLLVQLHGGPTGVALETYPVPRTYPTQLFAQHGFAVLEPNFRGSVNYGASWRMKNVKSQGFGDFEDVMTGIDHLIEKGIADPDRLGVMGWSYGGYLTSWIIGHTDRFKAASVGASGTDWISYYGDSDGPREVMWTYFGGKPWDEWQSYNHHSSRYALRNVRTPTLLLHGSKDFDHNPEIYRALSDIGTPVEFVTYPREGHGISEPMHQRDMMRRNLAWFQKWIMMSN